MLKWLRSPRAEYQVGCSSPLAILRLGLVVIDDGAGGRVVATQIVPLH